MPLLKQTRDTTKPTQVLLFTWCSESMYISLQIILDFYTHNSVHVVHKNIVINSPKYTSAVKAKGKNAKRINRTQQNRIKLHLHFTKAAVSMSVPQTGFDPMVLIHINQTFFLHFEEHRCFLFNPVQFDFNIAFATQTRVAESWMQIQIFTEQETVRGTRL